ncbi:MAG: amidase, partial [Acidobacteriaceae bacterium]|jgi:Asp-tRNA(Asn)/Glu-tRNA(Gln) amidotransferase A subunit family amidase|nr:amidase [Acidobacteriaceae bacterium]
MLTLNPHAREIAGALDEERRTKGARGILHGIPIVVKDNYATVDMPTTAGSKALEGFETHRDAFVVKKLREAGAVILGKTNLHELAYGITTISSMGGQTRNPYDPTRNPGGSSGGTGAAVAASFAAAGMGTDTCGSIRIPSAHNNLVGLRGTMGLSSRDGIVPLSLTQDIGGPLARTITDLAIMLDATVGADPADPVTTASDGHIPRTYLGVIGDRDIGDITIGILKPLFGSAPEDEEVAHIVREAVNAFRDLGATVDEIDMPDLDSLLQNTSVITDEFKFNLRDYLASFSSAPVHTLTEILASGRFSPAVESVLRRSDTAVEHSSSYRAALDKRVQARQRVLEVMASHGLTALVYPTIRRTAAVIGQPQGGNNCQLSATTDLPALAIPAGFTDAGLPVGMELLGTPFSEPALLKAAYAYEQVMGPRKAPASTPSLPTASAAR